MAKKVRRASIWTGTPKGKCLGCERASRRGRSTCSEKCSDRVRRQMFGALHQMAHAGEASDRALQRELEELKALTL